MFWVKAFQSEKFIDHKHVFGQKNGPMQGARLEDMRMHTSLKPACTIGHEAVLKIWQTFAATSQMGEFSFKHYLFIDFVTSRIKSLPDGFTDKSNRHQGNHQGCHHRRNDPPCFHVLPALGQ